jgi:hypothetical protein
LKIKMEDGSRYERTPGRDEAIQQLAIMEGLDTTDDLPCICAPRSSAT